MRHPKRFETGLAQLRLCRLGAFYGLLLTGCVVGPDYQRPEASQNLEFSEIAEELQASDDAANAVDYAWWRSFGDPTLVTLVERAVKNNSDLRQASAKLQEVRAQRRIALSGTKPDFTLESGASRARQSEVANAPSGNANPQTLFEVGLSTSWELDFFGRLARTIEAADAAYEASLEDRRNLILLVVSDVAVNYIDLRNTQRNYRLTQEAIEVSKKKLRLSLLIEQQGLATREAVYQAQIELEQRRAVLENLNAAMRASTARIAKLVGTSPKDLNKVLLEPSMSTLTVPTIPVGLASDLLERRPDIRAAERRLAEASARVGVETASRFPQFRLTGGLGTNAAELGDLFSSASEAWNLAGVLNWPIFDGGRREASVDAARARYEVALATYDSTVFNALEETESALAAYVFSAKESQNLGLAEERQIEALRLKQLRYETDLDDVFPTLEAQQQLLALQSDVSEIHRARLIATVNVLKSLGGGWQIADGMLAENKVVAGDSE